MRSASPATLALGRIRRWLACLHDGQDGRLEGRGEFGPSDDHTGQVVTRRDFGL